jgi:tetratricopeptide (TPR) repeat protein
VNGLSNVTFEIKAGQSMQKGWAQNRVFIRARGMLLVACLLFGLQTLGVAGTDEPIPAAIRAVLQKAEALMAKNEPEAAMEILTALEEKGEQHYLIAFTLGNCQMMTRAFHAARASYLKAVQLKDDFGPAWMNLANSYMELDQMEQAGDAFLRAYDAYGDKNPETLYYAASVYLAGNLPQKARDAFNQLMVLHPDPMKTEWLETRVHILLANNRQAEALSVMEQLARDTKGDKRKQWREFLLDQYLSLKMEKKALAHAEALTREEPGEAKSWKGLIHVNLALERYPEAVAVFEVYGRLFALSREEKKTLADLYLLTDLPRRAVQILEDLLEPSYEADLLEKLVQGYAAANHPEGALPWIEKGLAQGPGDPRLLLLKGEALFNSGKYAEALKALKAAVDREKTNGRAWLLTGYAAWYGNDFSTAVSAMKAAATFPGQRKQAEQALAELRVVSRGDAED